MGKNNAAASGTPDNCALGPSPAAPLGGRARGAEAPLTTKPPAGGE
jgi:hypothetical protein